MTYLIATGTTGNFFMVCQPLR